MYVWLNYNFTNFRINNSQNTSVKIGSLAGVHKCWLGSGAWKNLLAWYFPTREKPSWTVVGKQQIALDLHSGEKRHYCRWSFAWHMCLNSRNETKGQIIHTVMKNNRRVVFCCHLPSSQLSDTSVSYCNTHISYKITFRHVWRNQRRKRKRILIIHLCLYLHSSALSWFIAGEHTNGFIECFFFLRSAAFNSNIFVLVNIV
jgi:hypothetical protein